MAYSADISRTNPGCVLFLLDESLSMEEPYPLGSTATKADTVATILNRCLQDLIVRCAKEDGVRDYFDVGVISYKVNEAGNALSGELADSVLHPISRLEMYPLTIEERTQKVSDGVGGLVEHQVKFPVWYRATANGGTPMQTGLRVAAEVLANWCDEHPSSFPPVVIHLTDGQPTDGNPEAVAEMVRQLSTDDGQVILMNIHISALDRGPSRFPSSAAGLGDQFAEMLFRMSSVLPESMANTARGFGIELDAGARGFVFYGTPEDIIQFFDIGTRPSQLR